MRAEVPQVLLTREPAPAVPAEPASDPQIASYIVDLWANGDACWQKLGQVQRLVTPQ